MKCSKCGAEIVDGSKFCTVCGSRVDGKIVCPNCNTENQEGSTYCMACGKLLVNKRVCFNCNTELSENSVFCPNCGARYTEKAKSKKVGSGEGFYRVEKIVTPALLLFGLFFIFICSMLMGITVKGDVVSTTYLFGSKNAKFNIFYFFGEAYDDLLVQCGITKLSEAYFSELFPVILLTVVFACNIILCITMLTLGAVKFGVGVYRKQQVNLGKYFAWAFASFLFSLALLHSYGISLEVSYYYSNRASTNNVQTIVNSIKTVSNAMSVSGIAVSVIVGLGAFTLNVVAESKKDFSVKGLLSKIFSLLLVVFLGIALFGFSKNFCCISVGYGNNYSANLSLRALFFSQNALNTGLITDIDASEFQIIAGLIVAIYMAVMLLFGTGLAFSVKSMFDKKRYGGITLVLTAIALVILVAVFVMFGILAEEVFGVIADEITIESLHSSVASLVFTVLSLGLSVAMLCVEPKRQIEY